MQVVRTTVAVLRPSSAKMNGRPIATPTRVDIIKAARPPRGMSHFEAVVHGAFMFGHDQEDAFTLELDDATGTHTLSHCTGGGTTMGGSGTGTLITAAAYEHRAR